VDNYVDNLWISPKVIHIGVFLGCGKALEGCIPFL